MTKLELVGCDQIDPLRLHEFLSNVFRKSKSEFLRNHGSWWHRGDQNRWTILVNNQIAAYCGVIPGSCLIRGIREPVVWWVDIIVAPGFRGRGLQTMFDRKIRQRVGLKLGFPNRVAAKIHIQHRWHVREDLQVMILPLCPLEVKAVRSATGLQGSFLRLAAHTITPLARMMRKRLRCYKPVSAQAVESPSPEVFATVFEKYKEDDLVTTYRDAEYIRWRYLNAPYRSDLVFYFSGPSSSPTHLLVARHSSFNNLKTTRILDIFGDFGDFEGLRDILMLAVRDAILQDTNQITVMVTLPELRSVVRSVGFLVAVKTRFCWDSTSQGIMQSLSGKNYWTLADSDNDAPE